MTSTDPPVSVLMPVYNGRPYLERAVRSVLDQTFENFEFIIINDGSTDGSREVLERFAANDDRIRLVHHENQGPAASLNRGLDLARGRYIARMDADDVTHPERFERQLCFLESNPEIEVVGTQIESIDADGTPSGKLSGWFLPTDPDMVAWSLLFHSCLCDPSILARHSLFRELNGYAEWVGHSGGDYELWTRAVLKSRLVNLPEKLHQYRQHGDSITRTKRSGQLRTSCKAVGALHRALLGPSVDERISHFLLWMEEKNLDTAVEETGLDAYSAVHRHLRALYEAHARRLSGTDGPNIQVRRRALHKLDLLARKIAEERGWAPEALYKVRARLMRPVSEVPPWVLKAVRRRIDRYVGPVLNASPNKADHTASRAGSGT